MAEVSQPSEHGRCVRIHTSSVHAFTRRDQESTVRNGFAYHGPISTRGPVRFVHATFQNNGSNFQRVCECPIVSISLNMLSFLLTPRDSAGPFAPIVSLFDGRLPSTNVLANFPWDCCRPGKKRGMTMAHLVPLKFMKAAVHSLPTMATREF